MKIPLMEIRRVSAREIFSVPEFEQSAKEYAEESANPLFDQANPDLESYERLEALNLWRCLGAFDGDGLVGFTAVTVTNHPHFSQCFGSIESLWLKKEYRKGLAGYRLIRAAQQLAFDMGAIGVLATAPAGSRLAQLFSRIGTKTDEVFLLEK